MPPTDFRTTLKVWQVALVDGFVESGGVFSTKPAEHAVLCYVMKGETPQENLPVFKDWWKFLDCTTPPANGEPDPARKS